MTPSTAGRRAMDVEPMTLAEAIAYLKPDPANNGTISLKAPTAREAIEVIEAALSRVPPSPEPVPGNQRPPGAGWTLYGAVITEGGRMTFPGYWLPPGHPLLREGGDHAE